MKRFAFTSVIAAIGCASLVLAACGGGGSSEEPTPHPQIDCAKTPEQCK